MKCGWFIVILLPGCGKETEMKNMFHCCARR